MVLIINMVGWGCVMVGGLLFFNDLSVVFNNLVVMVFIDKWIVQLMINYVDIDIKYNGDVYDYQGNFMIGGYQDGLGIFELGINDGGQVGFGVWLLIGFLVVLINDCFVFGLSQVVLMGMCSIWDLNWKGCDFVVDIKIEMIGLIGFLLFKVNDNFFLGVGVIIQCIFGFVSQNFDFYVLVVNFLGMGGILFLVLNLFVLMWVKVDNILFGFFVGVVWKLIDCDILGFVYYVKICNKLKGYYNFYDYDGGLIEGVIEGGILGLVYLGLDLCMGVFVLVCLDIFVYVLLDWVYQFNDCLSLGVSVIWIEWLLFQDLIFKFYGNMIVFIFYIYWNIWILVVGGDYKVIDQWIMCVGVVYDQMLIYNVICDLWIFDGDCYFVFLGVGYCFQLMLELLIDVVYLW